MILHLSYNYSEVVLGTTSRSSSFAIMRLCVKLHSKKLSCSMYAVRVCHAILIRLCFIAGNCGSWSRKQEALRSYAYVPWSQKPHGTGNHYMPCLFVSLCVYQVFEALHFNLRETLKKFGKNVGISIKVQTCLVGCRMASDFLSNFQI